MDASVHNPPCFALFDPIAPECAHCEIQTDCINAQERHFQEQTTDPEEENTQTDVTPEQNKSEASSIPEKKDASSRINTSGNAQYIPEHTRKPLEIPPVGSKIRTMHKGKTYEAVIVHDPANKRSNGRSILFNGAIYRTLTAAAHAISPGINSGTVWEKISAS